MRGFRNGFSVLLAFALVVPAAATAATQLQAGNAITLSEHGGALKAKLVRLPSGRLVAVYGDYADPGNYTVYDVKANTERPARDVFVRTCDAATTDCNDIANWSAPQNVSGTATRSSMNADWTGTSDGSSDRSPFYGDSGKPTAFGTGSRVVVTWTDKFCPDGNPATPVTDPVKQRSVTYQEREGREVPFSCTYVVSSADGGTTWSTPVQLSSGERDAIQDVSRGLGSGQWAITWQEDPLGLQLGEAAGPGEGASGARVSGGTDIWYAYADAGWKDADTADGFGVWHPPVRLTDNTSRTAGSSHDTVKDSAGTTVDNTLIDGGTTGASRANLAVQLGSADGGTARAVVAYEESKGTGETDPGKFVRYHTFAWDDPDTDAAGCIISDPSENGRRVRFVAQKEPGSQSGLRLAIFWKEGVYIQGGPSDIVLRLGIADGHNGLGIQDLRPSVDAETCETSDPTTAATVTNTPALNLSSRTGSAGATDDGDIAASTLADHPEQNAEENAIAHRAQLRGDDLYVGYAYTPMLSELRYSNTRNYNFYLRHYAAAAGHWSAPENLSAISDTSINVREPRLVGTPGNGPGCTDPDNPATPEDCQAKGVFYVAWGRETNVSEWTNNTPDSLGLDTTRGEDRGNYYTRVIPLAGSNADVEARESQLRTTPAGNILYAVWNETDSTGDTDARFRTVSTYNEPAPATSESDDENGIMGCTYNPGAPFDPTLIVIVGLAIAGTVIQRKRHGSAGESRLPKLGS